MAVDPVPGVPAGELLDAAKRHAEQGHDQKALEEAARALKLYRDAGDGQRVADTVSFMVHIQCVQVLFDEAKDQARAERARFEKIGDRVGSAKMLVAEAEVRNARQSPGDAEEAADMATRARGLAKGSGQKRLQALADLEFVKACAKQKGDKAVRAEEASRYAQEASELFVAEQDRRGMGLALQAMAQAICLSGAREEWPLKIEEAIDIFRELQDFRLEASALQDAAAWYLADGNPVEALRQAEDALSIYQEAGERTLRRLPAVSISVQALLLIEKANKALRLAKAYLEEFREAGDIRAEATLLSLIASVHVAAGDEKKAAKAAEEAAQVYRDVLKDAQGEAQVLRVLAQLNRGTLDGIPSAEDGKPSLAEKDVQRFLALGDFDAAANALHNFANSLIESGRQKEALALALPVQEELRKAGGRSVAEATVLLSICSAYFVDEQFQECIVTAQSAAALFEAEGEVLGQGSALAVEARAHVERKELQQARQKARAARRCFARSGDTTQELSMRLLVAGACLAPEQRSKQQLKDAMREVEEAIVLARSVKNLHLEASAMIMMANVHNAGGVHEEAVAAASEALDIYRSTGDLEGEASALVLSADTCLQLKWYKEARAAALEVMALGSLAQIEHHLQTTQNILEDVDRRAAMSPEDFL